MCASEHDAVLVLAAGRGRRMGGPKALMTADGRPWWRWQHDRLDALGLRCAWVVSPAVHHVLQHVVHAPQQLILAEPDAPMFLSIIAGMRALSANAPRGVFVLPVDVPTPDAHVWQLLAGSAQPAIPRCGGKGGHPVYLPWLWITGHMLTLTTPSRSRLDHLLAGQSIMIEVDDEAIHINLNTPEDVQRWQQQT